MEPIRAFVALKLPEEIRGRLATVQQMLPLVSRVAPDNFHVTLAFLGAQPPAALHALHETLSALASPPLTLSISGLGVFGGDEPRLIHAEIASDPALDRLQSAVIRAAARAGIALKHRRFRPHVTLSRDRPRGPDIARLMAALCDLSGFRAGPFPVTEMALFRSTLGPKGARYDELAHYSLSG